MSANGTQAGLSREQKLELYYWMRLTRTLEERLVALVRGALVVPKRRKATKPSRGAKEARLDEKKKRGDTKRNRRPDFE